LNTNTALEQQEDKGAWLFMGNVLSKQ